MRAGNLHPGGFHSGALLLEAEMLRALFFGLVMLAGCGPALAQVAQFQVFAQQPGQAGIGGSR